MRFKKNVLIFSSLLFLTFLTIRLSAPGFFLFKKKPELLKNLPSNISVAEKQLNSNVQRQFPVNTSDSEITKELTDQGFEIKNIKTNKKIARFETHNFFCRLTWVVTWQVDGSEKIYDLKGKYNATCL